MTYARFLTAAKLQAYLGQLCGLTGARLARHDDHWVRSYRRRDIVATLADRQLRRKVDGGKGAAHGTIVSRLTAAQLAPRKAVMS